ncbi:MAG: T9SS type A sorting domain-containing protein [Prolixibacteraceae bacterium]|nr:T9SS type A sorting domain-containing protein [Prolixibacteraceae bacterium]
MNLNLPKSTLVLMSLLMGTFSSFSQNLIVGSNMEDASAWEQVVIAEGVSHSIDFNYTGDLPTGGSGGCLRIQGISAAADDLNLAIQQQVTLKKMTNYAFDLRFKDISADLKNFWFEVYLSDTALITGQDIGGTFFSSLNTWSGCGKGVDGLFSEAACTVGPQGKPLSSFGTTPGDTTLWLIMKMGSYDVPANPFDILIDDIAIKEVQNILGGNMEDASAWEQVVIAEGVSHSIDFNYKGDLPTGGSGGCLRIKGSSAAADDINLAVQQQVTLKKMTNYTFDLRFKDISADLKNFWFEVYVNDTALITGQDIGGTFFNSYNTWSGCGKGVDGLFSETACSVGPQGKPFSSFGTTPGDTTLWLIMKIGSYDVPANPFDILIDDILIKEVKIPTPRTGIILAGNMEDASAWEQVVIAEGVSHTIDFNYTGDLPTGGSGGCLRIQGSSAAADDINLAIQQQVTLKKMTNYTFDLRFKDISADLKNFWFEVYLNDTALITGQDIGGTYFNSYNTWAGCGKDVDGLFSKTACSVGPQGQPLSSFGTTPGDTTLWLIMKMGSYDVPANPFDVLIDDISITETPEIIDAIKIQKNIELNFYPNPVSTSLKVETQNGVSVYLLDLSGKVLFRKTFVNSFEMIDLSNFKSGIYLLRAETKDNRVTKKILKL